jgi:hypothetical protein
MQSDKVFQEGRPKGVAFLSVVAVLWTIVFIYSSYSLIVFTRAHYRLDAKFGDPLFSLLVMFAIANLLIAYGMWKGKRWSPRIYFGVVLVQAIFGLITAEFMILANYEYDTKNFPFAEFPALGAIKGAGDTNNLIANSIIGILVGIFAVLYPLTVERYLSKPNVLAYFGK